MNAYRNSDDFFPSVEAAHRWHVMHNIYNSLLASHLFPRVHADFDMFGACAAERWTEAHAMLRACSTARLWLSSRGSVRPDIMHKLLAPACKADGAALRPLQASSPVRILPSHAFNDAGAGGARTAQPQPLAVALQHGQRGASIALFNTQDKDTMASALLRVSDIAAALQSLPKGTAVAVVQAGAEEAVIVDGAQVDDATGKAALATSPVVHVSLDEGQCTSLTLAPMHAVSCASSGFTGAIGCVGLVDKYMPLEGVSIAGLTQVQLSTPAVASAQAANARAAAAETSRSRSLTSTRPSPQELLSSYGFLVSLRVVGVFLLATVLATLLSAAPVRQVLPGWAERAMKKSVASVLRRLTPRELEGTQLGEELRSAQRLRLGGERKAITPQQEGQGQTAAAIRTNEPSEILPTQQSNALVLGANVDLTHAGLLGFVLQAPAKTGHRTTLERLDILVDGDKLESEHVSCTTSQDAPTQMVKADVAAWLRARSSAGVQHQPAEAWRVTLQATFAVSASSKAD